MALTRTDYAGQISGTAGNFGTGDWTTANYVIPANSIVLVVGTFIENNGTTTDPSSVFTVSDSGTHTWTAVSGASAVSAPTSFPTVTKAWTAQFVSGATVTLTFSTGGRSAGIYASAVHSWTGYNTGAPTGATASGQQNGGFSGPPTPASITLGSAPAATSETVGVAGMDKSVAGTTPGSTYTETADVHNTDWGGLEAEVRGSSTSTTVDWIDLRSGGGSLFNFAAVAVEIAAASAAAEFGAARPGGYHPGAGPTNARFWQAPRPYDSVTTQVTADTGTAAAGLAAVSTTKKVAAVAGTASAGLAAIGAARKVAPETGTTTAGLSATGTIRKVAVTVDRSALGLAATDTAVHIAKPTGLSAAGLAGLAGTVRVAKSTGLSALGLEAFQSGNVPRQGTGQALLGLSASVTAKRVAKPTGTAPLGLCATSTTRRVATGTGRATAGLVARFAGIDLRAVTGRAYLGLRAQTHQCITYRSFTGSTARPGTGTTARPFTGTTTPPC